jgi:hypothetical protein
LRSSSGLLNFAAQPKSQILTIISLPISKFEGFKSL